MSTQIVPFNFDGEQVRAVTIDGEPWFVLADLANVLEIAAVGRLASRLEEGVRQTHTLQTAGGSQKMVIVSEAGMYEVVIRSDKPEAAAFRRWITGTVLPEIRKTGSYGVQAIPTGPELLALAILEADQMIKQKDAQIAELAPRADAWDELASGVGSYAVGDAAKMLQQAGIKTGRDRLFEFMREIGWVFRQSGRWQARQTAVDVGRLFHKPQSHLHPETGETVIDVPQVRVTVKGLDQLRMKLLPPLQAVEAVA